MAPFYGWGSTASRLQPLRGGSLLFTIQFPESPGAHFIDIGSLVGHMSDTSFFNGSSKPKNIFSWKIVCLTKWYQNIKWTEEVFSLEKMHFFLKALATFYKETGETIRTLELWE